MENSELETLKTKYLAVKQELDAAREENQLLAHAASAEANEHDSLRKQLADAKAQIDRLTNALKSVASYVPIDENEIDSEVTHALVESENWREK